jgi:hypothetical protein
MSVKVKTDKYGNMHTFYFRDTLADLEELFEILKRVFWDIADEHSGNMKILESRDLRHDNRKKKDQHLKVKFGYPSSPPPRSTPTIHFVLSSYPQVRLEVALSGLYNYRSEGEFFPLNEDYVRYNPRECFRKWFEIMTRDKYGEKHLFQEYIEERERELKAKAWGIAMGLPRSKRVSM